METQHYLSEKGWPHKRAGNQYCIQQCPLCNDEKWHFYINAESGVWDCKKCFASGNLYQLKKKLGDNGMIKSVGQVMEKQVNQKFLDGNAYLNS